MTETSQSTVTWLTQEAYDRLKNEHEHLSGPGRLELSKKIEAAREEGDLKENGGYHAAKEEQGKAEARIRQLDQLLRDAKVGEAPTEPGVAGPGMVVTVRFGDGETERFLIGSREDSATGDLEIYSAGSPLGKSLTGKHVGDKATFLTPRSGETSLEILEIEPYKG